MSAKVKNIVFPEGYSKKPGEVHTRGLLENVVVEMESGDSYALCFMDFYRLAEEFMRSVNYYEREWIAKSGLVIVKEITPEVVESAINSLQNWNYFDQLLSLSQMAQPFDSKDLPKYQLVFPDWYLGPEIQREFEDKGFLDDTVVEMENGHYYEVHFEDFITFTQRFAANARLGEVYIAEAGLIIVSKVSPDILKSAVGWLVEENYFAHVKPYAIKP